MRQTAFVVAKKVRVYYEDDGIERDLFFHQVRKCKIQVLGMSQWLNFDALTSPLISTQHIHKGPSKITYTLQLKAKK